MKTLNAAFQKIENFLVFTNELNRNLLFIVKPPQLGRLYWYLHFILKYSYLLKQFDLQ